MQKLLVYYLCGATLILSGCETLKNWGDAVPKSLDNLSLMYRQDVQQGNVITQETVNQLRPGMAKRQVQFILGTPILVDVFHQDRWDYIFTMNKNGEPPRQDRVALFFEDDKLMRIEGDFRPMPVDELSQKKEELVVSVPDYDQQQKGFFTRALEKMGVKSEDD